MSLTMRLGLLTKNTGENAGSAGSRGESLERMQLALRQAGLAEYEETPEKATDEPWTFRVHEGSTQAFQDWVGQNHLRFALTLEMETLRHLTEVNLLAVVYLPYDFSPPVSAADLTIASSPRLQQICQRVAPLLGIPDITLIPYDFTGLGNEIGQALGALSDPEPQWSDRWVLQFICTALFQGAALSIARHRALVLE